MGNSTSSTGLGWIFWSFLWGCVGYLIYGTFQGAVALALFSAVTGAVALLGVFPVIGVIATMAVNGYIKGWLLTHIAMSWPINVILTITTCESIIISVIVILMVLSR